MSFNYNKTAIIMLFPTLLFLYLNLLAFNSSILLSTILFIISFIAFKLRKSKHIKLSLITLCFLFSLANLGLGLYELNIISF